MKIQILFEKRELRPSISVIVESWVRVGGASSCGRQRRAYESAFTEEQRNWFTSQYDKWLRWERETGYPETVAYPLEKVELMRQLAEVIAAL